MGHRLTQAVLVVGEAGREQVHIAGAKADDVEEAALPQALKEEDESLSGAVDVSPRHAAAPVQEEEELSRCLQCRELWVEGNHDNWSRHVALLGCIGLCTSLH